jgi:hypothetical protein
VRQYNLRIQLGEASVALARAWLLLLEVVDETPSDALSLEAADQRAIVRALDLVRMAHVELVQVRIHLAPQRKE